MRLGRSSNTRKYHIRQPASNLKGLMDPAATLQAAMFIMMLIGGWVPAGEARVPAIYIFGDSTADVGNNNYLNGGLGFTANRRPYGIDYPTGKPTGRFCNGYVAVDFLAMMIGFKKSPPAALSVTKAQQENRGVNYASGGSGVLDATNQNVSISMNQQIKYFQKTVSRLAHAKGSYAAKQFLSKSIFIFSTFNNDLFGYYAKSGAQNATENVQFLSMLAAQFSMQLKEIYDVGARKFAIFGTGLVGCPPALRILNASGGCNEDLNGLSEMFNKIMEAKVRDLSSECREMKYSYIRSAETFAPLSRNPLKFGFKDTKSACCGGFSLGACNSTASICANRDEYMWWDAVHPTEAAYKATALLSYNSTQRIAAPINLYTLVNI